MISRNSLSLSQSNDDTLNGIATSDTAETNSTSRLIGTEGTVVLNEDEAGQELFYNAKSSFSPQSIEVPQQQSRQQQSKTSKGSPQSKPKANVSRRTNGNDDAFSSSSEDDDDEREYRGGRLGGRTVDKFAGSNDTNESSDDDDEINTKNKTGKQAEERVKQSNGLGNSNRPKQSEFDRALQTGQGVPSRGAMSQPTGVSATSKRVDNPSGAASRAQVGTATNVTSLTSSSSSEAKRTNPASSTARSQTETVSGPSKEAQRQDHVKFQNSTANVNSIQGSSSTVSAPSSWDGNNNIHHNQYHHDLGEEELSNGILPDVLMTMRQKIESMTLFDSAMMKIATGATGADNPSWMMQETRESLKRSSQQSISAAVLVSLAHKRYERRRLAAMEIEKVVRALAQQDELERVRAILLLLSDDYVRSTSEDARKGGVVALAASAIGLKKAPETNPIAHECRDLILASVVHACQDHSQRVRYYATESLFNVIKVIPSLAVQHFFILFEILRSLYADVDVDVKSGAELLDKKLKEVIVGAMNAGSFTADACVPVFARFVYMRNKATKRLTLTWLQELTEKLIGAPILEFLHLFLTGIFDMVADPTVAIRQSALAFLQSILPKLLDNHVVEEAIDDFQSTGVKVDFDKILQSLVTTMEHPDPLVRKISMYWVSKIVKAHIGGNNNKGVRGNKAANRLQARKQNDLSSSRSKDGNDVFHGIDDREESIGADDGDKKEEDVQLPVLSPATISVRNALPHVLPGILLSIGDTFHSKTNSKDTFLPDTTTHTLAEQTNACVQQAVRAEGKAYVHHLDSFIVALREELDSPGGVNARNPPAIERRPYRMDVKSDGTGIESQGWFRASVDTKEEDIDSMMMSRLCALHWIIVLYESVVPDILKAEYAKEFIIPVIHQLVDNPPERIIFKSLEVLAKITIPVSGEKLPDCYPRSLSSGSLSGLVPSSPSWMGGDLDNDESDTTFPMNGASVRFALDILDKSRRPLKSRDREVFRVLIQLHAHNLHLIARLSKVISYMCRLQPPEFVFVSFAVELDRFVSRERKSNGRDGASWLHMGKVYQFVSAFIQQMSLVLLNSKEAYALRDILKDCIGVSNEAIERDQRRCRLFHILLHSFSHNLVATTSLCLWGGACRTASLFLKKIDPLDINLVFLLELDKLVEMLERPLFRHLHVRMLEIDNDTLKEGSGTMLFQVLKSILMITPQSASYNILQDRLVSTSRFRQSVISNNSTDDETDLSKSTSVFVSRVLKVRSMHCKVIWKNIRAESLEYSTGSRSTNDVSNQDQNPAHPQREAGADRREWLGYTSKEEEIETKKKYQDEKTRTERLQIEEIKEGYEDLDTAATSAPNFVDKDAVTANGRQDHDKGIGQDEDNHQANEESADDAEPWKAFWSEPGDEVKK